MPVSQQKNAIKKITTEASSLEASALVTLYEIDISGIKEDTISGNTTPIAEDILRFHNMNVLQGRVLWFQGNPYFSIPINAQGFELSSSGELPRPKLSITAMKGMEDAGVAQLSTLKKAFRLLNDLVGAKVTRIRTFVKFLDFVNFQGFAPAFYSSNFASGSPSNDGWATTNADFDYPETVGSESDAVKVTPSNTNGEHNAYRPGMFEAGKRYLVSGKIYIDGNSQNISSITINTAGGGATGVFGTITTADSWEEFSGEVLVSDSIGDDGSLYIITYRSASQIYQGNNDVFYFKDIVVKEAKTALPGVDQNEPDALAEFPREVYYIESKSLEDKTRIEFELSSVIDVQNFRLPGRRVFAGRCPWTYRGEGCCYECKAVTTSDLEKQKQVFGSTDHLPTFAPPIANSNDELISEEVSNYDPSNVENSYSCSPSQTCPQEYDKNSPYSKGYIVYVEKNGIRYYFVSKGNTPVDDTTAVPAGIAPPNSLFWEPDQCSKTIQGCKLRWGASGSAKQCGSGSCNDNGRCSQGECEIAGNDLLPFGGFPGTNTRVST